MEGAVDEVATKEQDEFVNGDVLPFLIGEPYNAFKERLAPCLAERDVVLVQVVDLLANKRLTEVNVGHDCNRHCFRGVGPPTRNDWHDISCRPQFLDGGDVSLKLLDMINGFTERCLGFEMRLVCPRFLDFPLDVHGSSFRFG